MAIDPNPVPPYPLHESVVDKLDPEYVAFYNEHIINQQQVHYQPVAASRTSGVLIPGAGEPSKVGAVKDFEIQRKYSQGPNVAVRTFTPDSPAPASGYPLLIWLHGGGWVLGNINTENVVCTRFCDSSKCVVVTVDYRLAPENVWPAAVHDTWEALVWLKSEGAQLLKCDLSKVAIAGSSAGGNLAAIMTNKALESPELVPRFMFQLLVVPVTDNTADVSNNVSYKENENTAALPAVKMLWYRHHYLPNTSDWNNPEASPLYYPEANFSKLPPAYIAVAELDVLRSEGEAYADKLRNAGVPVQLKVYKGMPHPFLAMDGVLSTGKKLIVDLTTALKNAFEQS
ncbi:putative lipase [Cystobasidium minutum MCA 4210]|uniref:putative lipase n=1 Tax=Cystobasidium minutum MCA 4210 TaxID=1397322 RepID=UPI0034CE5100|eukprot:jgi/Rhomi1/151500/estExt_Genewise1.C_3_t20306